MANEFITDEHTALLQKLVREVVNDPSSYLGSKYMPSVALPVRKIRVEVIEASGGLTREHAVGTDPQSIQSFGSHVQEFEPAAYKETIKYDEKKILYFRELGQNDPSKRGIRQYIDIDVDRLNRRLEARIEKLRWDAIFTGGFSYMGTTFSFGVPGGNTVTPVGAAWATGNPLVVNNSAKPIDDLRYWLLGGTSGLRKYNVSKIVMNPNTARWILSNTNTLSYLSSYGANPGLNKYDINAVLSFLVPGIPPVEVYKGWYQEESLSGSKIVVADPTYFISDGKMFFEVSNLPGNDVIGEFVQGVHLASGTIDQPGFGKFLVVEDNTAPGTRGGPKNPFLELIAGVHGGVNMYRPKDVWTATVI